MMSPIMSLVQIWEALLELCHKLEVVELLNKCLVYWIHSSIMKILHHAVRL